MIRPFGFTWGNMLTTVIQMAAWGVCVGGLIVAILLAISTWRDIIHDQDDEDRWLPAERRRWRP